MLSKIFKKIVNNPTLMTWTKEISTFSHGLIVTPIILVRFTHEELAFWYLLQIMVGFGLLSEAGFAHTLERSVAYFFEGAKRLPKNLKDYKNSQERSNQINFNQLTELLYTAKSIYLILSFFTIALLSSVGIIILWNRFFIDTGHRTDFWIAYILMVINAFATIQCLKWTSFMSGTRHVAELNGFRTIVGAVRILGFLTILLANLGVEFLMLYLVLEMICANIYYKKFIINWYKKYNIKIKNKFSINKQIFSSLWSVTWKSGLNYWGYFFTQYGISLLIAQMKDKVTVANFLFTQRMLGFIRRIAEAPVNAHYPIYYSLMAVKKYDDIKKEVSQRAFISYLLLIVGFISFGFLGNILLDLIGTDKRIVETSIYILLCTYLFFEWNALLHGTLYISTNAVPFLIPALFSGTATVVIGYFVLPHYGVLGLVWMQVLLNLLCNFWFSTYLSLKLIKWPFYRYLYDIVINGPKYWINKTYFYINKIKQW